jgi:hypothetical protein
LSAFINIVSQAGSAFKRKEYTTVLLELERAFELASEMDFTELDELLYNALYDAYEMSALIAQLAVFEKNEFLKIALGDMKAALNAFISKEGGTVADLKQAMPSFILLLQGMSAAVHYLQRQKKRMDTFPPELSFEITKDGFLKIFAWSEETPNKIANIAKLKAEFELLYEKEKQSKSYFLETAANLEENEQYEDCLSLLDQAMTEHESLRGECFIIQGNICLKLKKYEEAVDAFMKARVLGEPKHRMSHSIKESCTFLLRYADSKEDKQKWSLLMKDFS